VLCKEAIIIFRVTVIVRSENVITLK